ncbi:hypothetical protein AXG93_4908s1170 [Marchantia polymorpha subsp. ruderalis]|uniref:Peptidase C76 domain-containing protein n=1 Tax=Marchantia polymorpha subsp. ruderalis TaxID=1480154 RepID=A0A176WAA7_MARPO|nr:hypothetical protein AXG93_4908s1170 [Marchantia polymorpha subsp. ruderalis]
MRQTGQKAKSTVGRSKQSIGASFRTRKRRGPESTNPRQQASESGCEKGMQIDVCWREERANTKSRSRRAVQRQQAGTREMRSDPRVVSAPVQGRRRRGRKEEKEEEKKRRRGGGGREGRNDDEAQYGRWAPGSVDASERNQNSNKIGAQAEASCI